MKTRTAVLSATLAITASTMLLAFPAQAQRVFVSGSGSDSNSCSYAAPCRTFQQAFNTVAANGEIDVLDPAGYGALTITHGITIQGHGFASITQVNGGCTFPNFQSCSAISISAGSSDSVLLNGLLMDGVATGLLGIFIRSGGSVQIVDCVIRHFSGVGVYYRPTNAVILSASNTVTSDSAAGIITLTGGNPPITLDKVTATGNSGAGVSIEGGEVMVTDSNMSNNTEAGLQVLSGEVMVKTSVLANNGNSYPPNGSGVFADGGTVWLASSAIYGNLIGINIGTGTVNSFGGNDFADNGTNVSGGSLTTVSPQ